MYKVPLLAAASLVLASCASRPPRVTSPATALIRNAAGDSVGRATLREEGAGVRVQARFWNVTPGVHAFHIHDVGLCVAPFTSAGPHYNPDGRKHGLRNPDGHHMGDMPNVTIAADSTGTADFNVKGANLQSGGSTLLDANGSALVVHAAADDEVTDPAGNAGARIACGTVGR